MEEIVKGEGTNGRGGEDEEQQLIKKDSGYEFQR